MTTLTKSFKRLITPEQLQEKKDVLQKEIERVQPLIKEYWDKGYRTVSVCVEVNIHKANSAMQDDDYKGMETALSILEEYPLAIMREPNKALGIEIIEKQGS